MNNYEKGSVIEFPNTSLGEFLVVDKCLRDNIQYVLVVPYQDSEQTIDIEIDKLVLLEIGSDESASVVIDKNIVSEVVHQFLNNQ